MKATATQIVGGSVAVGGLLWLIFSRRRTLPRIPDFLPSMADKQYPIPAETNRYPEPPASQRADLPEAVGSCPNISTIDQYNKLAKKHRLPQFKGELGTNDPDSPDRLTFNTLVTALKTKLGCYAPPDQDDTGTTLPSDYANQSVSYK